MKIDFTYSFGHVSYRSCVIFEVKSEDFVGFGEGMYSSEQDWPMAQMLGKQLIGKDALQREAILPWKIKGKVVPTPIREGMDIALHDLLGNALGIPVYVLLGDKKREKVPGMPVVHVANPEVMARRAKKWMTAGYKHIKVKLRGDNKLDLKAIQRLREEIGNEIEMQVDANYGYTSIEEVITTINRMKDFNVSIIEDPIIAGLREYRRIRENIQPKLMVDTAAYWPNIFKVIAAGAADIINHHPHKQGGLITALKIDAVAEANGIPSAIGSSGFLGIQDAAFQILSSVISLDRPCEDIGLLPYYGGPTKGEYQFGDEPSVIKNPYPINKGVIEIPDSPGLGIEIDRDKLTHLTEKKTIIR